MSDYVKYSAILMIIVTLTIPTTVLHYCSNFKLKFETWDMEISDKK